MSGSYSVSYVFLLTFEYGVLIFCGAQVVNDAHIDKFVELLLATKKNTERHKCMFYCDYEF
jgi:hypothetical protein